MKKLIPALLIMVSLSITTKTFSQCELAFTNLVISSASPPMVITASKCEYRFNASFDIITNSGFKYLFFHSWLAADYPSPAIFNCGGNSPSVDPGTSAQLGTAVDAVGKSFLDIGFINLNTISFPANTMVDVTGNFATSYPHDNTVVLTQPANSTGLTAKITRKGTSDTLHFDVSNIRIVVNKACGSSITVKSDIWGSNSNAKDPKAQCYVCGLTQSYNDPAITVVKFCASSPFSYSVGLSSDNLNAYKVRYRVYMDDLDHVYEPGADDALIFTSDSILLGGGNPNYSSGVVNFSNPYCCIDPWAQYGVFVEVASNAFGNILRSPIAEAACATLPVSLRSFTATRNRSNVLLKWETVFEENSTGFEIQRKAGSSDWETVAFVNTKAVNGSSNSSLYYELNDLNTIRGISQYRLKQVDTDGKYQYSVIRSVRGEGQPGKTIIYPNPSNDGSINIVFEDAEAKRDVLVMDMNGRTIRQWKGITNNNLQVENLNAGFYTIRIINKETGKQTVEKFVINKY